MMDLADDFSFDAGIEVSTQAGTGRERYWSWPLLSAQQPGSW
jgi:hypothetical protein